MLMQKLSSMQLVLFQKIHLIVSTSPSFFKANEGLQEVNSNTDNPIKPNPLAQTFKVENFDGGVFATSVDLFFSKKDTNIPL